MQEIILPTQKLDFYFLLPPVMLFFIFSQFLQHFKRKSSKEEAHSHIIFIMMRKMMEIAHR
jgi:hypothetical protein